jgi:membrane-bound lytic murein transglycosylase D
MSLCRIFSIITVIIIGNKTLFAGAAPDTGRKNIILAAYNKKEKTAFVTQPANVVFPDVLTGNEEQSLDYIEKFCNKRKDYIIRTYNKSKKFFPKAGAILKKYNLPEELKVLMALESAFNANAVSKAGAVGYWQFMDEVAREYGLKTAQHMTALEKKKLIKKNKKNGQATIRALAKQKDDRKNFNKSTCAAARYLKDRGRNLDNDLLLMVASYNCGIGNVWNAMSASGVSDPTFWDIKDLLPAETRAYVLNFITLNVVFNNYDKFADNSLSFKPVKVKLDPAEQNFTDEQSRSGVL